jgi:hypothetical protein
VQSRLRTTDHDASGSSPPPVVLHHGRRERTEGVIAALVINGQGLQIQAVGPPEQLPVIAGLWYLVPTFATTAGIYAEANTAAIITSALFAAVFLYFRTAWTAGRRHPAFPPSPRSFSAGSAPPTPSHCPAIPR